MTGRADVWIDGRVFEVSPHVAGELAMLRESNATLAAQAEKAHREVELIRASVSPANGRWTAKRKAAFLQMIAGDLMSRPAALLLWGVSDDEVKGWEAALAGGGVDALRTPDLVRRRS